MSYLDDFEAVVRDLDTVLTSLEKAHSSESMEIEGVEGASITDTGDRRFYVTSWNDVDKPESKWRLIKNSIFPSHGESEPIPLVDGEPHGLLAVLETDSGFGKDEFDEMVEELYMDDWDDEYNSLEELGIVGKAIMKPYTAVTSFAQFYQFVDDAEDPSEWLHVRLHEADEANFVYAVRFTKEDGFEYRLEDTLEAGGRVAQYLDGLE